MDKVKLEKLLKDDEALLAAIEPLFNRQPLPPEQWIAQRDAFVQTLAQGETAEFERLMADYQVLLTLENQQAFLDGFKLAAQMLKEVYQQD